MKNEINCIASNIYEELALVDYEKHPELKDIKELEGLIW